MHPELSEETAVPPIIGSIPPVIPFRVEPTAKGARIESLDVLRGFAVLGILVMNIQTFAMVSAAYMNPTAFGDLSGVNLAVWLSCHVFADQKFMSIFSMLFGAGIALMAGRSRVAGCSGAWLHYRRMFWLLLFGLAHAYLLWYGDILVTYALAGCVAFLLRKVPPGWLLGLGLGAVTVPFVLFSLCGLTVPFWPPDALNDLMRDWKPSIAEIQRELDVYRGGWLGQVADRAPDALMFQTLVFVIWTGWRAGGLMLIGMALLKWGVLSARRPAQTYVKMTLLGAVIGLPLILAGVISNFKAGWSITYSFFLGSQWNYWGSMPLALAYVGLIMLAQQRGWLPRIRAVLADVGRMALTNYLLQTIICTTLFYGHGLGWFGRVERWQQALVVLGVWIVLIAFTRTWLKRYSQGPFERVWRALTYWDFKRRPALSV